MCRKDRSKSRKWISPSEHWSLLCPGWEGTYILDLPQVHFWSPQEFSFIELTEQTFSNNSSQITLVRGSLCFGPMHGFYPCLHDCSIQEPIAHTLGKPRTEADINWPHQPSIRVFSTSAAVTLGVCSHAIQKSSYFMTTPIGPATYLIPRTLCPLFFYASEKPAKSFVPSPSPCTFILTLSHFLHKVSNQM